MTEYCYYCMNKKENNGICESCGHQVEEDTNAYHLPAGTVLNEKYLLGRVIGEGGFGITYIGRDLKLDMIVAVKEFYPTGYVNRNNESTLNVSVNGERNEAFFRNGKEKFIREARILAKFSGNKSIVDVRDFFECNNTAYIVMEYIKGVTLKNYIKSNGVFDAQDLFEKMMPLFRALNTIHKNGLIHRDISPDNIMMLEDGTLKLMDFGAAREVNYEDKRSLSILLKPGYAPEEQYRSKGKQGPWTDVYAVCATIYKCITGVTPDESTERVYSDELKPPSFYGITISENHEKAFLKGMAIYQKDRYQSVDELLGALNGKPSEELSTLDITDLSQETSPDDMTEFYEESPSETDGDGMDDDKTEYYTESSEEGTENGSAVNQERSTKNDSDDERDSKTAQKRDRKIKSKKIILIITISVLIILIPLAVILSGVFKNTNSTPSKSGGTNTEQVEVVSLSGDTGMFSVGDISIALETSQGNGLDEEDYGKYLYHISFDINYKFDMDGTSWSGTLLMPDGKASDYCICSEKSVWIPEKDAEVGQYTYKTVFFNKGQQFFTGNISFKINSLDTETEREDVIEENSAINTEAKEFYVFDPQGTEGEETFDEANAFKITGYEEALDFNAWKNLGASVLFENGTIRYDDYDNEYMIGFSVPNVCTYEYDTVSSQGIDLSKYDGKTIKGKAIIVSKSVKENTRAAFDIIEIDE